MFFKKKLLFQMVTFLSSQYLLAQQQNLDTLVVSALNLKQSIIKSSRNIQIITAKQIQESPANSIDELLKYAAGIEVQQRGVFGAQADINMRGSTFQQILVLVDGLKINDPITGHFSGYFPVNMAEIERIEILKGPASVIYGSEAVGGIIHIITKTFSAKKISALGSAATSYGSNNSIQSNVWVMPQFKKIKLSLGSQYINSQGYPIRLNQKDYVQNFLASLGVQYVLNNNLTISARSVWDSRNFKAQNYYTTFASDDANENVRTNYNQLKLDYKKRKQHIELGFLYKQTRDSFLFNTNATANINYSKLAVIQLVDRFQIRQNLALISGAYVEFRRIESNDRGYHNNSNKALFTAATYNYKRLDAQAGVRFVSDAAYKNKLIPQISMHYLLVDKQTFILNARALYGGAIRTPDFTELYNNFNKTVVTGGSIGNPNLVAEQSQNIEVGFDLAYKKLSFQLGGFYRKGTNIIDYVPTPYSDMPRKVNLVATGSYSLSKNIAVTNAYGLEIDAVYSLLSTKNSSFYITSHLTWLYNQTSEAKPSFYIMSAARLLWQTQANISYKNKLQLSLNHLYKERKPAAASGINAVITKSYHLLNAKVQYKLQQVNIFVQINNLANIRYSDLLGSIMPKRMYSLGLQVNF